MTNSKSKTTAVEIYDQRGTEGAGSVPLEGYIAEIKRLSNENDELKREVERLKQQHESKES